jgi:Uma2 family endonuclease
MEEYIANGAKLGWSIDPIERKACLHRPDAEIEVLDDPATLTGNPLLSGFRLHSKKNLEI